jgi:hypothetical protein
VNAIKKRVKEGSGLTLQDKWIDKLKMKNVTVDRGSRSDGGSDLTIDVVVGGASVGDYLGEDTGTVAGKFRRDTFAIRTTPRNAPLDETDPFSYSRVLL